MWVTRESNTRQPEKKREISQRCFENAGGRYFSAGEKKKSSKKLSVISRGPHAGEVLVEVELLGGMIVSGGKRGDDLGKLEGTSGKTDLGRTRPNLGVRGRGKKNQSLNERRDGFWSLGVCDGVGKGEGVGTQEVG